MLNSESVNGTEGKTPSPAPSPNQEENLMPSAPVVPKAESPSTLHHPDAMSLARLQLFNSYRWPVQQANDFEEYRVRWEGHASHLLQQVSRMEHDPASADVTVATKGFTLPAHRIVLAAASKFFNSVLQCVPTSQHPVIVVRGADPRHLRCVITFCYTGVVNIPAQDVQQVVKLADDLEISGLKVSCLTGSNSNTALSTPSSSSSPSFPTPGPHRTRLFRPSSPKKFTFTPIQGSPSPTSARRTQEEDPSYGESQLRKRFKGEPLPLEGEEILHQSSPAHSSTPPPGSAPPLLPSTSFFGGNHPSPPNSAPPHAFAQRPSSYGSGGDSGISIKNEISPLSLVSPSRLLEPQSSAPPSPAVKKESPIHCISPSYMTVPSTPNSLAFALKEPLTPSTPKTPTTPNMQKEGVERHRLGDIPCNTACSTGSRVLLWRFLLDLLHNPRYSPIYIRWLDRPSGIFRIMESDMVAQLWGMARKNTNMNYEKMSRGMRTYYKRGILFHIDGTKLIYKFNTTDPEIQQRMRYYDLTQKSENAEAANEQNNLNQISASSNFSSFPNLSNLPAAFPNLTTLSIPVTSSASGSSPIENLYSPYLRDVAPLPTGLLYEPYLSIFRASHREMFS